MRDEKFYITEYIYDVVSRYMAMPAISLVTVTNGSELIAGSTFIFIWIGIISIHANSLK